MYFVIRKPDLDGESVLFQLTRIHCFILANLLQMMYIMQNKYRRTAWPQTMSNLKQVRWSLFAHGLAGRMCAAPLIRAIFPCSNSRSVIPSCLFYNLHGFRKDTVSHSSDRNVQIKIQNTLGSQEQIYFGETKRNILLSSLLIVRLCETKQFVIFSVHFVFSNVILRKPDWSYSIVPANSFCNYHSCTSQHITSNQPNVGTRQSVTAKYLFDLSQGKFIKILSQSMPERTLSCPYDYTINQYLISP